VAQVNQKRSSGRPSREQLKCKGDEYDMKTFLFDSLDEADALRLTGCKVIDESGEPLGTFTGLWMDSTSHRVEFVGVKSSAFSGQVHVMPAGDAQIIEEGHLRKLCYPAALIKKAPSFSPGASPARIENENANEHSGRSGAPKRVNSIDESRPEESIGRPKPRRDVDEPTDRRDLESGEQAFFNQKDFITDAMPEADASQELLRSQNEAKIRNREDRIKNGSLD
jgi:hypothetical protein